jgi:DNA modification methylase
MIEWNKVYYCDCLDPKIGLTSLPDRSIDLCITDPPWNINYKGSAGSNGKRKRRDGIFYNDKIQDYELFSLRWFYEIKRICNRIIFTPGIQNLKMWYRITEPTEIILHYKKNGCYGGRISVFNCFDPFLYYGKTEQFFIHNVIEAHSTVGFCKIQNLKHGSPKNRYVWNEIIKGIKPDSVIDPFIGSGTTAEVCTKLGIPWIGYEINEIYKVDIETRLKNCVKEPEQMNLLKFVVH